MKIHPTYILLNTFEINDEENSLSLLLSLFWKELTEKKTEWRLIEYYVSLRPRSATAIKAGGAEFTHFSYFFLLNPLTTNVPII